jgi:hypothetical protein
MFRTLARTALAAALAFTTLAASTSVQARDGYRHRGGGDDDAAIAIGAGLVGLAIGAAIASDGPKHRRHYDNDYYYHDRGYPRYRSSYYYDGYPRHYRKHRHYRDRGYYRDRHFRARHRDGWNDRGWNDRGWNGRRHDRHGW